jgi:hypothetical protein
LADFSPAELQQIRTESLALYKLEKKQKTKKPRNTPFRPSQEKFHTFVLRGVRNISHAP